MVNQGIHGVNTNIDCCRSLWDVTKRKQLCVGQKKWQQRFKKKKELQKMSESEEWGSQERVFRRSIL